MRINLKEVYRWSAGISSTRSMSYVLTKDWLCNEYKNRIVDRAGENHTIQSDSNLCRRSCYRSNRYIGLWLYDCYEELLEVIRSVSCRSPQLCSSAKFIMYRTSWCFVPPSISKRWTVWFSQKFPSEKRWVIPSCVRYLRKNWTFKKIPLSFTQIILGMRKGI